MTAPHSIPFLKKFLSRQLLNRPTGLGLYFVLRDLLLYTWLCLAIWYTDSMLLLPVLWLLMALVATGLYILGHDCAHGALFNHKLLNKTIGVLVFLPTLHPYGQWKYGHNTIHHARTAQLRGDLAWHPRSPGRYQKMNIIAKTMHRLYWSLFGAGLYYTFKMWLQGLIIYTGPFQEARRDRNFVVLFGLAIVAAVFFAGAYQTETLAWQKGLWFVFKIIVVPFYLAQHIIGMIVYLHHIHPEVQWHPREKWNAFDAQLFSTTNYILHPVLNFFLHNIMIHSPHHVHPRIPFYNLPAALNQMQMLYGNAVKVRQGIWRNYKLSTKKCKLFDASTGNWQSYPDLETRSL